MHFGSFSYRSILQNKRTHSFNPENYDLYTVIDPLSYVYDSTYCFGDYRFLWNLTNTDRYVPINDDFDGSWSGFSDGAVRSAPFIANDGVLTFREQRKLLLSGDGRDSSYWHDTSTSLIASVVFRVNEPFTTGNRAILYTNTNGDSTRGVRWSVNSSGQIVFSVREGNGVAPVVFSGTSPQIIPGQIHIATVVKSLKTYTLYIDGIQSISGSVVSDISGEANHSVCVGANSSGAASSSLLGSIYGLYIFLGSNLPSRADLESWMQEKFKNNAWSPPPKPFNSIYHWTPRTTSTASGAIAICYNHGDISSSLSSPSVDTRPIYINTPEGRVAEFDGTKRMVEPARYRPLHTPTGRMRIGFVFRAGGENTKRVLFSTFNLNSPGIGSEIYISTANELAVSLRNSVGVAGTVYADTDLITPGELYTAVLDKNDNSYTWYLNGVSSDPVSVLNLSSESSQQVTNGIGAAAGSTFGNPYIGRLGPIFIFDGDDMPSPEEMSTYLSQFSLSEI